MSKKNITEKAEQANGAIHVTFLNEDGTRTYAYRGSAKRAILRGKDPASLYGGKLVSFKPKEKQ